ncbi:hypothetical protein Tco_0553274 [Tanacetum coccineum]
MSSLSGHTVPETITPTDRARDSPVRTRLAKKRADETPTPRLPTRPTWVDPEDGTVYIDIEFNAPLVRAPVETPASPEWSSGSLPVSPASLTVPSPIASPVITPAATIAIDEDEFLEFVMRFTRSVSGLGAWNERMNMPLSLLVPYGDQFWPLRPGQGKQTPREQLYDRLGMRIRGIYLH